MAGAQAARWVLQAASRTQTHVLRLGLAGDSHCCYLPGGMRRILSPARPSRLATSSDDRPAAASRSHLGWEPIPCQPLKHRPKRAFREPWGTPGGGPRSQCPCGAGGSCSATVGAPRRGCETCKAGRANVEAGEVGDLQIPEESAFPVPSSFPPTWT